MSIEYRVVWKRVGIRLKRKRYVSLARAQRFIALLGPEPWTVFGKLASDFWCCRGGPYSECGCEGQTWKEHEFDIRENMPAIEFVRVDVREVGEWKEKPDIAPG